MPDISHLFIHYVDVNRPTQTFSGTSKQPLLKTTLEQVAAMMKCRIEPLQEKLHSSVIGRFPQATHSIFWNDAALRAEDRVTWNEKNYVLLDVKDFFSNHHEGYLQEMKL